MSSPTALAAKEGRQYGISLGLVRQRPAEIDATVISQCNTLFAMRMGDDCDQPSVAAENLLRFLPSLGMREVLAFGAGMVLPTRFTFYQLPEHLIPRSKAASGRRAKVDLDDRLIKLVTERWRGAMTRPS